MPERITVGGVINQAFFAAALVATIIGLGLFAIGQEVIDANDFGTSTQMGRFSKMKSVGRIQIPGTLGYDISYVHRRLRPRAERFASSPTARSLLLRLTSTPNRRPSTVP